MDYISLQFVLSFFAIFLFEIVDILAKYMIV